ncbi:hypothetical protein M3215_13330 [Bacillus cytotoxicus]|uniref:Uncharacterized protein n=1 Tax=Bacillus cytotoxicus TaxID=580165 RepID=A0ACC6A868_9BACI|nr:hypothetical protein [Bacillus cytotoxicus]
MNLQEVSVKIVLENNDGTSVVCNEKAVKINEKYVLSVYEDGIQIQEFIYGSNGEIILGEEALDLQGVVNDSAISLEEIGNMSAVDFLLAIANIKRDLH